MTAQLDIYAGELGDGRFNIVSNSKDGRARLLSNFVNRSFMLERQHVASVEGFIQAIKHPHGSTPRWRAFLASGSYAKSFSNELSQPCVWWHGRQIPYGSSAHHHLIERAIVEKFRQNDDCRDALVATGSMTLVHDTGAVDSPHTSLPAAVFCDILTRLRTTLQKH